MAKKSRITAGEIFRRLNRDEEYIAERKREQVQRREWKASAIKEQRQLLDELQAAGIEVETVWDLVNSPNDYDDAIPILVRHLDPKLKYSDGLLEGIVRALSCPGARGIANNQLAELYGKVKNDKLRWVIGNALAVVATAENEIEITRLIGVTEYGESRNMLPHALARIKGLEVVPFLLDLLEDSDLTAETIEALGNLRAESAKNAIKSYIDHEDSWIRGKARAAMKKLPVER